MDTLISTFLFFIAAGGLFLLPGWIILRIFFGSRHPFLPFETLLFSFGLGIGFLDFLMIALGKSGIGFSSASIGLGMIATLIVLTGIAFLLKRSRAIRESEANPEASFLFTRKQGWLFVLLIALTLLIKGIFLIYSVLPTATDLGHHMYWAKLIATEGTLPLYAKQEIITDADGVSLLTAPELIDDFIIGEHLPFAAISIFTGLDFFSAFPVLFLFLINLLGLLALFMLALRLASGIRSPWFSEQVFTPQNVALAALFFFGPLYALASPQAKFISGGVVGNIFGNFLIPLVILAYYQAFREKSSGLLALGFFLTFTLAYTHHLSTLILLFLLIASVLVSLIFRFDSLGKTLRS